MADIKRCPTCGRRVTRSTEANRRYFKLVSLLADKPIKGIKYTKEEWHEWAKGKFLGSEEIRLPNGNTVLRTLDTHGLPVDKFNEYMHELETWCANIGVWLED